METPDPTMPDPTMPQAQGEVPPASEFLNIKVKDNTGNELYFKLKPHTRLQKVMDAFCDRQGKDVRAVRFLFEGERIQLDDTAEDVSYFPFIQLNLHFKSTGFAIPRY